MKIGILTFHRAINYGAVIQCYALSSYLEKQGYDVEIIDYRTPFIEKYRKVISLYRLKQINSFWDRIKYVIHSILHIRQYQKRIYTFDNFLKSHLRLSKTFFQKHELEGLNYDVVVFGSDQIWNKRIANGFDDVYWGNFRHRSRFVAYAASIGDLSELNKEDEKKINGYLGNFCSIGVREVDFKKWIEEKLDFTNVCVVLDPTLLQTRTFYDDIAVKPKQEKYVLIYALESVSSILPFARNIAEQLGCNVIRMQTDGNSLKTDNYEIVTNASPEEFLGYFKYATCTILASFHGTVFSTIFQKDFYLVNSPHENRAKCLLENLELGTRLVDSSKNIQFTQVNYDGVKDRLNLLRNSSIQYLKDNLICK